MQSLRMDHGAGLCERTGLCIARRARDRVEIDFELYPLLKTLENLKFLDK